MIVSKNFLNRCSFGHVKQFNLFSNNLFSIARSLDGSGRHNRPRGFSYALNKIFSYREYEKYRREHHRQRFRSVTPYWIQRSLRDRKNFRNYYTPFSYIRKRLSRLRLARSAAARIIRNHYNFKIGRIKHISFLNYSRDFVAMQRFLNKSLELKNLRYLNANSGNLSLVGFLDTVNVDDNIKTLYQDLNIFSFKKRNIKNIDPLKFRVNHKFRLKFLFKRAQRTHNIYFKPKHNFLSVRLGTPKSREPLMKFIRHFVGNVENYVGEQQFLNHDLDLIKLDENNNFKFKREGKKTKKKVRSFFFGASYEPLLRIYGIDPSESKLSEKEKKEKIY